MFPSLALAHLPLLLLQAAYSSPMGTVPGFSANPAVLNNIARVPNVRPLDPNGIDVYGELPVMQRAFANTANGRGEQGKMEAGYSIFPSNPGYGRTGFHYGNELHMSIPVAKNGLAVVHTHPYMGQPQPSPGDLDSRLPNYVYSGNQLYVTDPRTHKYYQYDIDKWNVK